MAILAFGMVIAACSPGRPELRDVPTTGGSAPTELSEAPRAIVSPTGVVVPVLSVNEGSYVVSTPCGAEAELGWGQPLRDVEVVLDPGHGGDEEGATQGDITEASVNLMVAQRTAAALDSRGVSVTLTRSFDYRLPITSRTGIIEALSPKVYISIHHNSSPVEPSDSPGSEVYVQSGSDESKRLGGLVYAEVLDLLSAVEEVDWISASDAGVLSVLDPEGTDAYGIVRGPSSPGVLAELAYLSNPSEADFVVTEEYQQGVSNALADAVAAFLSDSGAEGRGFVDSPRQFPVDSSTGGAEGCIDPVLE